MKPGGDALEFLRQTPLLQGMDATVIATLARAGGLRKLQKGQILFLSLEDRLSSCLTQKRKKRSLTSDAETAL